MSLRSRLAFGAAAAVALAVILASAIVYVLVRSELNAQIDQSLRDNARTVAHLGFAPSQLVPGRTNVYVLYADEPALVGYYQIVTAAGNVYVPDDYLPTSGQPPLELTTHAEAVATGNTTTYFSDTSLEGVDTRVLTMHVEMRTVRHTGFGYPFPFTSGLPTIQGAAIQVALPLSGVDHELAKIKLWLFLVALGGVAIAAGAGFLVARQALRPVRKLSETAERVRATHDLSQRISVEGSDELAQLALTFNEMLAALDEAATRQRRLVQDASHELRTPLTSLRTNIEVLADGGALSADDRAQLLRDVITQLGELTALVSELTELARGEDQPLAPEEVRLDLLAGDAIRRTLRNHPDVTVESDLAPTTVVATPAGLERAIANLLDNAAKWSPAGEPVEVRVRDGEISVRDHGPGIAEADLPHIFERFYRATSARSMPGSGLGLAIVRQVAEAHGGTVTCEQAPGGGTLMRLRLPAGSGGSPLGDEPLGQPDRDAVEPVTAGGT